MEHLLLFLIRPMERLLLRNIRLHKPKALLSQSEPLDLLYSGPQGGLRQRPLSLEWEEETPHRRLQGDPQLLQKRAFGGQASLKTKVYHQQLIRRGLLQTGAIGDVYSRNTC